MSDETEFLAFGRRIMRAMGRRLASADPDDLVEMIALRTELDAAIAQAVAGMRQTGYSWTEIGAAVGISKQAALKKWGQPKVVAESTTGETDHDPR